MSSTKCPNCDLTNFASALYCKRCNGALQQPPPNAQMQNNTQIYDTAKDTQIRPIVQPRNNDINQANVQNPYQKNLPNNYGQGYRQNQQHGQQNQNHAQNQYNQQNQHNRQNHAQNQYEPQNPNYSQNQYGQQNHGQPNQQQYQNQNNHKQPPLQQDNSYALPRFPKGERPIRFNHYQKNPYQPMLEHPYRKLGSDIALHKNSTLPEVCVRCGQRFTIYSGGRYVTQKFRWHHPAVYAALISPLIYAILAACLSERFTVSVPLCSAHIGKRESTGNWMLVSGLIAIALIVLISMGGYFSFAVFIGVISVILISLNYEYGYKSLRVARVEGSYYHLKGASDEFLHELPY
jgi:hypothetical protein